MVERGMTEMTNRPPAIRAKYTPPGDDTKIVTYTRSNDTHALCALPNGSLRWIPLARLTTLCNDCDRTATDFFEFNDDEGVNVCDGHYLHRVKESLKDGEG